MKSDTKLLIEAAQEPSGSLQIGDQWNAIRILASSQTHSLKAVCELVENAIDARATRIEIIRRKQNNELFLDIIDNGVGVRMRMDGKPDFTHLATHICDSMKRRLTGREKMGIHGEFGIGLLSFWSLGEELRMISTDAMGYLHELSMRRGDKDFTIQQIRGEGMKRGTRITVGPLLDSTRNIVTGEKIQRYLSAELRERIRSSGVVIEMIDRLTRKELVIRPHEFSGDRLAELTSVDTKFGTLFVDLYLRDTIDPTEPARVSVFKDGTRVLEDITELVPLDKAPWNQSRLEGVLDYPALNLAPGTRRGVVPDACFQAFVAAVEKLEPKIAEVVTYRDQAASARANRRILVQVQKAFLGALRDLEDQYLYFDVPATRRRRRRKGDADPRQKTLLPIEVKPTKKYKPGTLAYAMVTPRNSRRQPNAECILMVQAFDVDGPITEKCQYEWKVIDGIARITSVEGPRCVIVSPVEGRVIVEVTATRGNRVVTDQVPIRFLDRDAEDLGSAAGLPTYRLNAARGEPWRSKYVVKSNEIVINSAHRDFVSSNSTAAKHRRYIGKLYAKEIVLLNFPHESNAQALERLIEVTVRTEDAL